ncbi:hypothetical protein GWI33_017918 [Rhynchophorus ferrugineus]|uniref:Sodium/calcium exchanger membrane region domain-containing protein n=1 Tax=Rhynchophorus ferrugineus TaxID=354439 RepID=A0A834M719_RHYFE|nr:hypothetical protein GWI33_017918 [Rhynchophorus ferrugineus]
MGMLLRTKSRRIALGFKIFCVVAIGLSYLVVGGVWKEKSDVQAEQGPRDSLLFRRHLLGLDLNRTKAETQGVNNVTEANKPKTNCTPAAIKEFPPDGLTRDERKHGWVLIHVLLACYLFIFLAVVCDDYFVPSIQKICSDLNLKEDIAGATFMATASSSAEIFINSIGTFITQGDLGVGTIVGSAVFNILAVPACCGLFCNMVLELEWYSITRDSVVYGCSVVLLIIFLQDGRIYYYEALTLVLVYSLYVLIMIFNNNISSGLNKVAAKIKRKGYYREILNENQPLLLPSNGKVNNYSSGIEEILDSDLTLKDIEELEESTNIWVWPKYETKKAKTWWIITWPISLILYCTIPNCRIRPKMYPVTFIMCVFWIGTTSYIVAWLITVIGDTLEIPDSVMGLTFLAAGTSVPEAVSSVLVTNQGYGSMGISSSIGSNTFDILLCLGIPWFIKSAFYPKVPHEHWITINSQGINYSAICLLSTLIMLYLTFYFNKFKLDWKIGLTCITMYIAFLIFASLIELNVFFPVNLPTCDR